MKILIVTHFFPPLNSPGSLRTYSFAKYFKYFGEEVFVLTTKKYGYEGSLDLNLPPQNIKVYEVEYPPFSLLKRKEKKKIEIRNHGKNQGINIIKSILRFLRRNFIGQIPDPRDGWIIPAVKIGKKIIEEEKIDIVLSSFSPPPAHIIASCLKMLSPIIWIADYRDLWIGNHLYPSRGLMRILEDSIERFFLKNVDYISTVSVGLQKKLKERFKKEVFVIYNGFEDDEYNGFEDDENEKNEEKYEEKEREKDEIKIVYTGTIYPGKRDPSLLLRAVKNLRQAKNIKVYFYGNLWGLREIVKREEAEDFVMIGGFLSFEETKKVQESADVLLLLEQSEIEGIITQKIFEYMKTGNPILALGVDENGEVGEILKKSGIGFIAKNVEEIKSFLLGEKKTSPNWDYIKSFSRKNQAKKFLEIMKDIINK